MFQTCVKKQFSNAVIGDENCVYYFEPVRKFSKNIWVSKHSRCPIIAKRSLSAGKVWYAIFYSGEGVAITVPMEKRKKITVKHYKDIVLEKPKKYYQKRRSVTAFKHIRLLHGNVPAHASEIVTAFLKKEKVTVCLTSRISSNGCHSGPIFFKPEKNLEFFRLKNGARDDYPGKLEWLAVNNLVYFWWNSGWVYDCNSFLGYWEIT